MQVLKSRLASHSHLSSEGIDHETYPRPAAPPSGSLDRLSTRGILWCIDPATGLPDWKERVARGGTWGSIVSAGDRMYLLAQSGTTVVFKADKEGLEILAENEIDERTNSTLAVVDGEIFLRTHEHLYCIAAPR